MNHSVEDQKSKNKRGSTVTAALFELSSKEKTGISKDVGLRQSFFLS